jgi:hypothetical protein
MNKIQNRPDATHELDRIEVGERAAEALATPPEKTPKSIIDALEYARAFQQVAAFLAANPDLAKRANVHRADYTLIPVPTSEDPGAFIVDAAQRAQAFGAQVEEYAKAEYGGIKIHFGRLYVQVYTDAERVCQKVVVGMVEDVQYALAFDLDGTPRKVAEVSV